MRAPRSLAVALLALVSLAPAAARSEPEGGAPPAHPLDATGLFVQPNARLADGSLAYVHVTESDMPLRVAVGKPPMAAKYASREQTRLVAIEAMQAWERAIQPLLPWFRLEFVEDDRDAPVQVKWKRRIPGSASGFGQILFRGEPGALRVGGRMELSTALDEFTLLDIDEVRLLVAHEFGHVLGLGHCLDCDSVMSYAWETRNRVLVTDTDARTFAALVSIPNLEPATNVASAPPGDADHPAALRANAMQPAVANETQARSPR